MENNDVTMWYMISPQGAACPEYAPQILLNSQSHHKNNVLLHLVISS